MTTPLCLTMRQLRLQAVRDGITAVWLYTGSIPTYPEDETLASRLGIITLANPAGAIGAEGRVATLSLIVPQVAVVLQSGICGWGRFVDASGDGIMDLEVTDTSDPEPAGKLVMSDTRVYEGGELQLISCICRE